MGTDQDWERWGATDPYFGVYSDERFRVDALTKDSRDAFFRSGHQHVERVLRESGCEPQSVLDFGCGVGRLVIPFAKRVENVTGVDISPSMIALARKNCAEQGIRNASFQFSDDELLRVRSTFDLVHSYIVLQHIPWKRGQVILNALAHRVKPGGCLAVQMIVGHELSPVVRGLVCLRYAVPPVNWVRNILRGRPMTEPPMQLHIYDLETVRRNFEERGFACTQVEEPWPGYKSIMLYARRAPVQ